MPQIINPSTKVPIGYISESDNSSPEIIQSTHWDAVPLRKCFFMLNII